MATKNQFAVINSLRKKVSTLVEKSYTLNQAVKSLQGIASEEELEALGLKSFALANVQAAWADALRVDDGEGNMRLGLYTDVQVTVETTDPETGEPKEVNAYERKEGKGKRAGVITFKALKVRMLTIPEKWTPSVIVEGLVQSKEWELAKLEAEVSLMHRDNVLRDGAYRKVTDKDTTTGTTTTRFEKA